MFLKCETDVSRKESVKIINTVAKDLAKEYYGDEFQKTALVKTAIHDSLEDEGSVSLERVASTVFSDNPQAKKEYVERVQQAGVVEDIPFPGEEPEKGFRKQKIKTDNGIEVSIPMHLYKNRDAIEFIANANGTISILIKDVSKIASR